MEVKNKNIRRFMLLQVHDNFGEAIPISTHKVLSFLIFRKPLMFDPIVYQNLIGVEFSNLPKFIRLCVKKNYF